MSGAREEESSGRRKTRERYVATGAGLGIIFGAALGAVGTGMVLGAAAGILKAKAEEGGDDRAD